MMHQHIVSNIPQVIDLFLFFADIYAIQERSHNISHLVKKILQKSHLTQVQAFFYTIFEEFNNGICEEVRLQQLKKAKYSISAAILHFSKTFSYRTSYLLPESTV